MIDVLLINAPVRNATADGHARLNPPLGLAYIGAVLLEHGYTTSALDLNISGMNLRRIKTIVKREEPKILGISTDTETHLNGLKIAQTAKMIRPDLVVIMGGPHASVMFEEVARNQSVDFVVIGEGEQTMLELVDNLLHARDRFEGIRGIAFSRNGREVLVTPERPFVAEPDDLPFPARGLFPLSLYAKPGTVLMSRGGCPFSCTFCAVNSIWKGRRRFRRPESVTKEILLILEQLHIQEINFADDTFTLNRQHVVELCKHLTTIRAPTRWRWTCGTRVDLVDKEILQKMHDAGCHSIQFGVEAGSQEILDSIGKGTTLDQVREAVRSARDTGMEVLCAFMFPHPQDTEKTIREQKSFMSELAEMGARESMSFTTPYPGTFLYEHADELGIDILPDNWDDFSAKRLNITTKHLSKQDLEALLEELVDEVGLTHF